jgi:alkylhydroperoxidase family enzyme
MIGSGIWQDTRHDHRYPHPDREAPIARRIPTMSKRLDYNQIAPVTRVAQTGVPDGDYEAARAILDERELVDLTLAVGLMNAYNRMAISFRNTPRTLVAG